MRWIFLLLSLCFTVVATTQILGPNYNSSIRKGNSAYANGNFEEAAKYYEEVFKQDRDHVGANFNLANALYKLGNEDSALYHFNRALNQVKDPTIQSKAYYNQGNAYLQKKEFEKSVDAYKKALKINPADEDARYNLSYAMQMLKKQQQQQQQNDKQQQENQKNNQQNQQGDQGKNEDQKGDENQQKQENQDQAKDPNKGQNQSRQMTREEANQILDALNNREKNLQKDMQKKQSKSATIQIEKDW